jgi:hypothetical protein
MIEVGRLARNFSTHEGNRQCMVADLIGLDGVTFWSDAVSESPTGEHWADLSVQL